MQKQDRYLIKKIKEARRRIFMLLWVEDLLTGTLCGMVVAAGILFVSLFVPMYYAYGLAAGAMLLGAVAGSVTAICRRPNLYRTALMMDAKGLQERVTTAYELIGQESGFAMLLKTDVCRRLETFSIKKAFARKPSGRRVVLLCCMAVLVVWMGLVDAPARKQARKQHAVFTEAEKQIEALTQAMETVKKEQLLDAAGLEALEAILSETKEELSAAKDDAALEKATERAQKKLEQQVKDLLGAKEEKAAGAVMDMALDLQAELSKEQRRELTDTLEQMAEAAQALQDAANVLESAEHLTAEQLEAQREQLEALAAQLTDEEIKAIVAQAASQMTAENLEAAAQALANTQGTLMQAAFEGTTSLAAVQNQMTAALAGAGENAATGDGNQSGNGDGQGSGTGSGAGTGTGTGTGSGTGNGKGGGWYQGGDTAKETKEQYTGDYVSVPAKEQDNDNLTGKPSQGTQYTQKGGPAVTWEGNRQSYQSVIGAYEKRAYERVESGAYPADMQDVIKNYFESLNQ